MRRSTTLIAVAAGVLTVTLAVAAAVLLFLTRSVELGAQFAFRGWDIVPGLAFGLVGALMAARQPRNPVGWLTTAAGLALGVEAFGSAYATFSIDRHAGTLPLTTLLAWVQNFAWVPMMGFGIVLPLQLFPDGRPLSPRWGLVARLSLVAIIVFSFAMAIDPANFQGVPRGFTNPYGWSESAAGILSGLAGIPFIAALGACAVSVVIRYRRSEGSSRDQMKWLAFAGSFNGIAFVAGGPLFLVGYDRDPLLQIVEIAIVLAIASLPVATGIAILRHRLLDVDVVINKAVVFGAIAAAITALYVAVTVGIGAAIGTVGELNIGLSVAATALVALTFQPLRAWAQRLANRFVYGERATPDDVLSILGDQIADASSLDDVLPRLAQLATEATAASRGELWVREGTDLRRAAAWPHAVVARTTVTLAGEDIDRIPGAQHAFAIKHQGELLGALAVDAPPSDPLTPADQRLLADLASHAGLFLRNVALIDELRASRQRLVAAQDQERRRIERNLHDGAQQELVALVIKLRLARSALTSEPERVGAMLEEAQADASGALDTLRELARGIYPPMLQENGLAAALRSQAEKAVIRVEVSSDGIARYPMETESAVYFCVLEALQNVAKYAGATLADVSLREVDGHLEFSVTDDGAGFDVATVARGSGTQNMHDRIEALGGKLHIGSRPGHGTSVIGSIPTARAGSIP